MLRTLVLVAALCLANGLVVTPRVLCGTSAVAAPAAAVRLPLVVMQAITAILQTRHRAARRTRRPMPRSEPAAAAAPPAAAPAALPSLRSGRVLTPTARPLSQEEEPPAEEEPEPEPEPEIPEADAPPGFEWGGTF